MLTLILTRFDFVSRFLPHGAVTSFLTAVQLKPTLLDLTHVNINYNAFRLCFAIPTSRCCDNLSACLQLKPTQLDLITPTVIFNMFRLSIIIPSSRCCDNFSYGLQLKSTQLRPNISQHSYLTCFDFLSQFLPYGIVTSFLTAVQLKPNLLDLTHANFNF